MWSGHKVWCLYVKSKFNFNYIKKEKQKDCNNLKNVITLQ